MKKSLKTKKGERRPQGEGATGEGNSGGDLKKEKDQWVGGENLLVGIMVWGATIEEYSWHYTRDPPVTSLKKEALSFVCAGS